MNSSKITYSGKKVYVGIDVHKSTYSVSAVCENRVVKESRIRSGVESMLGYLEKYFKGAEISTVYEAGFSGYKLRRGLIAAGIKNIVVNPGSVAQAANNKVKTDRLDAKKLGSQLSYGILEGIYIPSEAEELNRLLSRSREQTVEKRSRVGMQIKSKLHYFGMMDPKDNRKLSIKYIQQMMNQAMPELLRSVLESLVREWLFLKEEIKEMSKQLAKQASEQGDLESIYRSVPGVGPVSARVLSNELGDLSQRFINQKRLYSYTGLTPSEHSSGKSVRKGHISRQGSSRVRKYLIEIAWRAIEKDPALEECFARIASTRGKKRAIVAIARKILGRIRACFIKGSPYQLGLVA